MFVFTDNKSIGRFAYQKQIIEENEQIKTSAFFITGEEVDNEFNGSVPMYIPDRPSDWQPAVILQRSR
ncbi:hypothetical protein GCM10011386_18710 [Parapedobacter defluvii]|uniref:Uncharacterized protein n=1 Tax=Parapedobacter defluvii TaxID=2045106 RepID=A0ABQ1LSF2_9SPHI|nr:hypothetical protein GCM10011386_18710 [Parapedobacter defluvii]